MTHEQNVRSCPYCKEPIKADAIKCKHCASSVTPAAPRHEGICPYCKEEIHPEATRCRHCQSDLRSFPAADCGCVRGAADTPLLLAAAATLNPGGFGRPFGELFGDFDCLGAYGRCRDGLRVLGVPDEDAIRWCAFKYWGCTVRRGFYESLFG